MPVTIKDIDFVARNVALEVARTAPNEVCDHLSSCGSYFRALNFRLTRIYYAATASADLLDVLVPWAREHNVTLVPADTEQRDDHTDRDSVRFLFDRLAGGSNETDTPRSVGYRLSCNGLSEVLKTINCFVLLVGRSVPIDPRVLYRLRLCVYELAANTVEHATFDNKDQRIGIVLHIDENTINVVYRDNSRMFSTTPLNKVRIEDKMKSRSNRGLGLFLLRKMASNLVFERQDEWNCTSFTIAPTSRVTLYT